MTAALDLGSHTFRSLRGTNDKLVARSVRPVCVILPDNALHQRRLEKLGLGHSRCDAHLVLLGDAAIEFSRPFEVPCTDLLPGGVVSSHDSLSHQFLEVLLSAVLPQSAYPGEKCSFTQPGSTLRGSSARQPSRVRQTEIFDRLIRQRGYAPNSVTAGEALALAELVESRFSGIALVMGAANCEITVMQGGHGLSHGSIPMGGSTVDEQFARERGDCCTDVLGRQVPNVAQARRDKEQFSNVLTAPASRDEKLLGRIYRQFVLDTAAGLARHLAKGQFPEFRQPTTLVLGGGSATMPGVFEILAEHVQRPGFPVKIDRVQAATAPYAVARGCLIHAELEAQSQSLRSAA